MTSSSPRVAVVGAGPSGLYAAAALATSAGREIGVDVFDRLPAPFGLVRYGVAPDHVKMKSVISTLKRPFENADVRFIGNVPVGRPDGIPLDVLHRHYRAVICTTGSSIDRTLGVPGEELAGSLGSGQVVGWYSGHPEHVASVPPLDHRGVAVIGAGNVALDVARVLARHADEMATTDVPNHVLDALRASRVRDIHIVIRRGPQHVRFTPAELRQLGALANAEVVVHDDGLLADARPLLCGLDRRQTQNIDILSGWPRRARSTERSRTIHLHFFRAPRRIVGADGRVTQLVVERSTEVDGHAVGQGTEEVLDVGLIVRAIGYTAEPVAGLPFDERTGTVPNAGGRVLQDGVVVPGAYVAGWIKRGPSGVIGRNKGDAVEIGGNVFMDLDDLPGPATPDHAELLATLTAHGAAPIDWTGWTRIDAREVRLGATRAGAERVKVADLSAMLAAAEFVPATATP